jgi:leucyl/phenylalanyl-tRNA--protein transferase
MSPQHLSPELLLRAYASGIFPMAEHRDDARLYWVDPPERGVLPLDGFHISRSLRRRILRAPYRISFDRDFAGVIAGCADRPETWINSRIVDLCLHLHASGHAHSVELWDGGTLVGGSYGVALGGAFFAESMFSRRTDASKIALAYLVDRLRAGGFVLMDTQFLTDHLASLGGVEIPRATYHHRLARALAIRADFHRQGAVPPPQDIVQRNTQTSKRA